MMLPTPPLEQNASSEAAAPVLKSGDTAVLCVFGTHGDVAPFVSVGVALQRRGVRAVVATSEYYRDLVVSHGLDFVEAAPSREQLYRDLGMDVPALMQATAHKLTGMSFAAKKVVTPYLAQGHRQLFDACRGAQALISHVYSFAAPLVAQQQPQLAWRSLCLQPLALLLPEDAPVLSELLPLHRLAPWLGPQRYAKVHDLVKGAMRPLMSGVDELRKELGLPAAHKHPLFEGSMSPQGTFGMFDPVLMSANCEMPLGWHWAGFCHQDGTVHDDEELDAFLTSGPAPVVFTLGSAASQFTPSFYEAAQRCARRLGIRAVLLAPGERSNDGQTFRTPWASHARLFPRARAVVHQGGMGTLSQALRAGVPQVVVPFGNDQPDNAHRLERLGVSKTLRSWRIDSATLAHVLSGILHAPKMALRAQALAKQLPSTCGSEYVANALTR